MRHSLLGIILVPLFASCSSDEFAPNPTGTVDGGPDSHQNESGTDGSMEGGSEDSSAEAEAEAGPTTWLVHVDVTGHEATGTSVQVLSSTPDGSTYAVTPLDPTGKMDVDVVDGGAVHLLVKYSQVVSGAVSVQRTVFSEYDIVEESTVARKLSYGLKGPAVGDITFYPDGTFPGGTTSVQVTIPCEGDHANSGNPYAGIVFDDLTVCPGATEYWAAAIAFNSAGKAISAQLLEHIPVASSPTTIYISFGTPASFVNKKTTFSPLPPDADLIQASVGVGAPTGGAYGVDYFPVFYWHGQISPPPTTGTVEVPGITKGFSKFVLNDYVSWMDVGELSRSTWRSQVVSVLADATWDPTAPARFESLSQLDLTDLERPIVSYALESSGLIGECIQTFADWYGSDAGTQWWASKPANQSSEIQFPDLPTELAEFNLSAGQTVQGTYAEHFSPATGDCRTYDRNELTFVTTAQTQNP